MIRWSLHWTVCLPAWQGTKFKRHLPLTERFSLIHLAKGEISTTEKASTDTFRQLNSSFISLKMNDIDTLKSWRAIQVSPISSLLDRSTLQKRKRDEYSRHDSKGGLL